MARGDRRLCPPLSRDPLTPQAIQPSNRRNCEVGTTPITTRTTPQQLGWRLRRSAFLRRRHDCWPAEARSPVLGCGSVQGESGWNRCRPISVSTRVTTGREPRSRGFTIATD
jgi:hypothetical protein